jgi:hypothetical protein
MNTLTVVLLGGQLDGTIKQVPLNRKELVTVSGGSDLQPFTNEPLPPGSAIAIKQIVYRDTGRFSRDGYRIFSMLR